MGFNEKVPQDKLCFLQSFLGFFCLMKEQSWRLDRIPSEEVLNKTRDSVAFSEVHKVRLLCGLITACMVARGHVWLFGACMVVRGACMVAGGHVWLPGGGCGCGGRAWLPEGRWHAWLPGGTGVVAGVHAWLPGGMCSCWGACVVAGGHTWLPGGHEWLQGACMVAGGACIGYDEIWSMSRQYASYWNAFLFIIQVGHG